MAKFQFLDRDAPEGTARLCGDVDSDGAKEKEIEPIFSTESTYGRREYHRP